MLRRVVGKPAFPTCSGLFSAFVGGVWFVSIISQVLMVIEPRSASEPDAEHIDLCEHVYTSWGNGRLVATVFNHVQSFLLQLRRRQNTACAAASDGAATSP